jgi:hypothetical protein
MAALPESSTERYRYTYQNSHNVHTIMFRTVSGTPTADVDAVMQALMSNIGVTCIASTVLALDKAAIGSDIFNPVGDSVLVGDSFGSGAGTLAQDATFLGFVGRGDDGRRARFYLYGIGFDEPNFRLTAAESTGVATMLVTLNDPDVPLLTIGGSAPIWKGYANWKASDHWVKRAR